MWNFMEVVASFTILKFYKSQRKPYNGWRRKPRPGKQILGKKNNPNQALVISPQTFPQEKRKKWYTSAIKNLF